MEWINFKKGDKELKDLLVKTCLGLIWFYKIIIFFLAEAKPTFTSVINQIDKTDDVFEEQKNYIKKY